MFTSRHASKGSIVIVGDPVNDGIDGTHACDNAEPRHNDGRDRYDNEGVAQGSPISQLSPPKYHSEKCRDRYIRERL